VIGALVILPVSIFGYLVPVLLGQVADVKSVFDIVSFLMIFLIPIYCMRLLAEERRSGTLEVILTSPVRDWELVVGKWLGAFVFYLATIAFTLVYVVLISVFQQVRAPVSILGLHFEIPNVDYGQILTGYAGLVLLGAAFTAIGVLSSSLTQSQIVAFMVAWVILVVLWYIGLAAGLTQGPASAVIAYVAGQNRYNSFGQGQINLKDVTYFVSLTLLGLFLATRVVESRKWR
jgi:ABC-2 type transport system permease protein